MKNTTILAILVATAGYGASVSPLLERGYTVLPAPRQVKLDGSDFQFGRGWRIERGTGVVEKSVALEALREEVGKAGSGPPVRLEIVPGSVDPAPAQDRDRAAIAAQAYHLQLSPGAIRITANADAGLFYAVETLIQLAKHRDGTLWLPKGEITDWPDLHLRIIYWDDAHHLERLSELKRAIRTAAFFRINGFAIKLEGHFQYSSAPALVEPYALSPGELQELTDYGLRYYVEVIPYLDAPAHIAFILKHPEYARLRAFPDSNYELCTVNPESYRLITGMFGDLLAANRGVSAIVLSTDEPYYVGRADNAQCNEAARARELGSVGGVLNEFTTKVATWLHSRARSVIFWGEYPLQAGDIASLPNWMINGETCGPQLDREYRAHGIRQMFYTSAEGEEKFVPTYFALPRARWLHHRPEQRGRVEEAIDQIRHDTARRDSDLMGSIVAGWADMGLHPETLWLGYAAISAAAWNPEGTDPAEAMNAFFPLFYGPSVTRMDRLYQLMSLQAQTWNDTWEQIDSTARKPIWGDSDTIFRTPHPAHDQTLPLPEAPAAADLSRQNAWAQQQSRRLETVDAALAENDELLGLLYTNLRLAEHNRYGLEVFLSIARLFRQNLEMVESIGAMDDALSEARRSQMEGKPADAVAHLDAALEMARQIRAARNEALDDAAQVWLRSWDPRVGEANGRRFLHQLDDVKDHLPDRTVDMSYLVYRELLLPMDSWYGQVESARNSYASAHQLSETHEPLDWKETGKVP